MEERKKQLQEHEEINDTATEPSEVNTDVRATAATAIATESNLKWGAKTVTRKFLALALAAAVLFNLVLSAGMNALFARKHMRDRPANEQIFDNNQRGFNPGGRKMPLPNEDRNYDKNSPDMNNESDPNSQNDSNAGNQGNSSTENTTQDPNQKPQT